MKAVAFNEDMTQDQRRRAEEIVWKYRRVYATKLQHLKAGVKTYAGHIAYDSETLEQAKPRPVSMFQKKLLSKYLKSYEDAGIIGNSMHPIYSNCYLLQKKLCTVKTIEQVESAMPEELANSFRLVVCMDKASKSMRPFSESMLTV